MVENNCTQRKTPNTKIHSSKKLINIDKFLIKVINKQEKEEIQIISGMKNILKTLKIKLGDIMDNYIPIHFKMQMKQANSLKTNLLKMIQEEIENTNSASLNKLKFQ